MIIWSVILIFYISSNNIKRILISFILYLVSYFLLRNNILPISIYKLFSLISFSLIMSGLILLDDISNLPFWKYIPFSADFFLIGQLTSGFLPHLKKDIITAWNYLISKYSLKRSRLNSLKMLLFALLIKIRDRKSELSITLLSRGYTIHGERKFLFDNLKFKPEDIIPLTLGFVCLFQLKIL